MAFGKPLRNGEERTLRREGGREELGRVLRCLDGVGRCGAERAEGRGQGPGARVAHGAGSAWGLRAGQGTQDGEHFETEQVVSSINALRTDCLFVGLLVFKLRRQIRYLILHLFEYRQNWSFLNVCFLNVAHLIYNTSFFSFCHSPFLMVLPAPL